MSSHLIWNMSPEIFSITIPVINFNLAPRWYGLLFASGIFCGYKIMEKVYKKAGRTEEELSAGLMYFVIATIVGARLGHVLFYDPVYYFYNPIEIIQIYKGGLASHGGTIGIFLAMYLYCKKYSINFMWLADRVCYAIAFGVGFIRLGNFFNSEMVGHPSNLPWAIIFEAHDNIPRHPGQLYEAAAYFSLFFVMHIFYKKWDGEIPEGKFLGMLFTGVFTARFFIEYTKLDQVGFEQGLPINMGQILSLPMIAFGLIFMTGAYKKLGLFRSSWQNKEG